MVAIRDVGKPELHHADSGIVDDPFGLGIERALKGFAERPRERRISVCPEHSPVALRLEAASIVCRT